MPDLSSTHAQPNKVALFVSDLHLQESMPRTAIAFFKFLDTQARISQQLYMLGDIFEYWAGDDDLTPFNRQVIAAIRAVADSGVAVFWIAGNRDFLAGPAFAKACGLTILTDPTVADFAEQKIVLTHGDALCTDDLDYMAFRAQVRDPAWQKTFLARSLTERKAIVAELRQGSRDAQSNKAEYITDVNADAVSRLFQRTSTTIMIHGHTHRPAVHTSTVNGIVCKRYVLPDWDCDTNPIRGGWIGITVDGRITRMDTNGLALS